MTKLQKGILFVLGFIALAAIAAGVVYGIVQLVSHL